MAIQDSTLIEMPDDVLRVADLTPDQLEYVLSLAVRMKALPRTWHKCFLGETIACYFTKPSTRTRVSFEAAAQRLGMLPIMLRPDELQVGRGEPISDTARVLSGYCAAIVMRTFDQLEVEAVAGAASVPVINALTDDHHPCQALADLLTLKEHFGSVRGLEVAYLGDGNNVAHSLIEAAALTGIALRIGAPLGCWPDREIVREAQERAALTGASIVLTTDPIEAVTGADAVYTDVWMSMGDDAEPAARLEQLRDFQVCEDLMGRAHPDAIFMHCLPAHGGEEVTPAVIDGPQSVVFAQAANRLPTEEALLYALLDRGRRGVV